jgi:hypothetical protein
MTDYTPTSFAQALLATLGEPVTDANVQAITAWEAAEGGNWHNSAHYNPLNTTLPEPGSYTVNSAGVRAYTSWDQGMQATVSTLQEGSYSGILGALQGGNDPQGVVNAILQSPWGTQSLSLGMGTTGGGTGATSATPAVNLTGGLTSSLSSLVIEAAFIAGGVVLLVVGLGKLTGTNPLRAAAHAAPGPL